MSKNKTWEEKWEKGDRIGKGGQGLTYFAHEISSESTFAIKFLKEQKVSERRERMFIEVSALKILNHPSIPKHVDSNEEYFKDDRHELYLVSEYIAGPTLEEFISTNGVMPLEDAIRFTKKLAEIIKYCHEKGVIHRDIKPDNIILRNGELNNPFLIDFGLSFNEELSTEKGNTPSWQHLGNRFLSLPELRVSEGNKRDFRSDVTMVCGIFLFCLTSIHPTDLIDEKITKPHRRLKEKSVIDKLTDYKIPAINNFFDIAFNQGINDRWQTINSVIIALNDIEYMKPEPESQKDINQKLESFKEKLESRIDYKQLEQIRLVLSKCNSIVNYSAQEVIRKLMPTEFGTIQTGHSLDVTKQTFTNQLGLKTPYSDEIIFYPQFSCYSTGSEFVFEALESGKRSELARFQLNEEFDWIALQQKVIEYYVDGITSK
jgi:eukaryotic-like serine/threonine-protein kinase